MKHRPHPSRREACLARSFSHFFAIIAVKGIEGAPLGVRTSSGHIVDFHFHLNEA